MQLHALSLTITAEEIRAALANAVPKLQEQMKGTPADGLSDPNVAIEGDKLVFSVKKKVAFMPITLSATLGARALDDGSGVELTLAKISAGFVGSEGMAASFVDQIGRALQGRPGCSVSGNRLTFTKEALAAWRGLSVTGSVRKLAIADGKIEIDIG